MMDKNKLNSSPDMDKDKNSINGKIMNSVNLLLGMSHEIRTYINAIVGFSSLLKTKEVDPEESEDYKNQIFKSCDQLVELFDSFLDSAIIDTGYTKSELSVCNLDSILNDLIAEFREELEKSANSDVILETECHYSGFSEFIVDSAKVTKVIRCLFKNAVRNTKSGFIKIGYEFNNGLITFYILDSSQCYYKYKEFLYTDDMNKSLKIFFDTGSAINISLARKLIQFLGGVIWINWNGYSGTGIYFSVPVEATEKSKIPNSEFVKSMNIN
jgi:K+-sensing histidine kinase KdpD